MQFIRDKLIQKTYLKFSFNAAAHILSGNYPTTQGHRGKDLSFTYPTASCPNWYSNQVPWKHLLSTPKQSRWAKEGPLPERESSAL